MIYDIEDYLLIEEFILPEEEDFPTEKELTLIEKNNKNQLKEAQKVLEQLIDDEFLKNLD